MKKLVFTFILSLMASGSLFSQSLPGFYSRYSFLMTAPGAFQDGMAGYANPANLKMLDGFESRFYWNTDGAKTFSIDDWAIIAGADALGFAAVRRHFGEYQLTDYRLSTAMGHRGFAFGLAYGWATGDDQLFNYENLLVSSILARPNRFLSIGVTGNFSTESSAREGFGEIAVRPFGNGRFTLFADAAIQKKTNWQDAPWSAGAAVEILKGLHLSGRYFDNERFTVGLSLNLGHDGLSSLAHYHEQQDHQRNSYMFRAGSLHPSFLFDMFGQKTRYYSLNLKGEVEYHRYRFFDDDTHPIFLLLKNIRAAGADPRVALITLNLSGMEALPEHAWEIRQELENARQNGKTVIIFIDRAGMTQYHLASVADAVVMDPQGMLELPGYLSNRTYFKGTLNKLGLKFDEWRFFTYKSAAESFSRDSMSAADRRQRQAYVDDLYTLVREEVCDARRLSRDDFDRIINEKSVILPEEALQAGLVDTLARWSQKRKIIENLMGGSLYPIGKDELRENAMAANAWGRIPQIAVVYGLGVCDMDEGIRARWLERQFLNLKENKAVKAVVFRVDSPGGDGMASDLVAEAIRKCSEKKPVIISQGQVAGSGGYWISMYGDQIIAGPGTVTGSIGVIGGWLYDQGFAEKTGMSSDYVKRGEHADLTAGVSLPLIGATLPARNLTAEEFERMKYLIKQMYEEFVAKVAQGRELPVEYVREIAEGRFYSGTDGQAIGLVDEIGTFLTAVAAAYQAAGIDPSQKVKFVEIPEYQGLFDFNFIPSPVGMQVGEDAVMQFVRTYGKHPLQPLFMMLPDSYPVLKQK
ncbi:MAG: signal peptide peptidase SppA [Calditrichia bacterium]